MAIIINGKRVERPVEPESESGRREINIRVYGQPVPNPKAK